MTGVELIAAERERQVTEEGWTAEHDDGHTDGAMGWTAVAYIAAPERVYRRVDGQDVVQFSDAYPYRHWGKDKSREMTETIKEPGRAESQRVTDRVRLLTMAGALIAAEIDRELRMLARGEAEE